MKTEKEILARLEIVQGELINADETEDLWLAEIEYDTLKWVLDFKEQDAPPEDDEKIEVYPTSTPINWSKTEAVVERIPIKPR
jgi:hypothetical protein